MSPRRSIQGALEVRRVLKELLRALGESFRIERFVNRKGLLQRVDPRIKLLSFAGLIVVAVLLQTLLQFLILLLLLAGLAVASRLPLGAFFRRQAMIVGFAAVIVLPLPFITPGYALLSIPLGPWRLWVTFEGVYRASLFAARVWVCVAALTLLTLSTRFAALLNGMQRLHFPRLFIELTAVTYRFLFVFTDEAYRMGLAREARTVRKEGVVRSRTWRTLSSMIGTLFIRAYERGEKVYQAMLARGYTGDFRLTSGLHCGVKDWGFGIGLLLAAVLIYFAPVFVPVVSLGGWL
jgi:cobalt/nickel transport system permease protein